MLRIFTLIMCILGVCCISSCAITPPLTYYRDYTTSQSSKKDAAVIFIINKNRYSQWIRIISIDGHPIDFADFVDIKPGIHNLIIGFYIKYVQTTMFPGMTETETSVFEKEVNGQISVAAGHSYVFYNKNGDFQSLIDFRFNPSEATIEDVTGSLLNPNLKDVYDVIEKYWITPHPAQHGDI